MGTNLTKQDETQGRLMAELRISLRTSGNATLDQLWTQFEQANRGTLRWLGEARRNAIYQATCDLAIGDTCQVVDKNSLYYGRMVKITSLPTPDDKRYGVSHLDGWGALLFERKALERLENSREH